MVWVPPGPFLMGSDKARDPQAFNDELPQHKVTLSGYWIGRHPVTVAQFRAFIEISGHQPAEPKSLKGPDDHPVVYVTWYEAVAFCRWLGERTRLPVTLPSEAEWEKAARGTDGRIYPWGNEPPDQERCNFEIFKLRTTPVGRYSPRGDSPYGCTDMAGNVWEWTRSLHRKYPYDPRDGRENLEAGWDDHWVFRGGAFYLYDPIVRCAHRGWSESLGRLRSWGFRIVASPGPL
jgi:formylglycine-generating enzyme required for sulfatase activity